MKSILVTGPTGFIGSAVVSELINRQAVVRGAFRRLGPHGGLPGCQSVPVGEICSQTDWSAALVGVDCIIHCASRAHVIGETVANSLVACREVNVAGTRRLAECAAAFGVRRLIFLSSIKVNGESTDGLLRPFRVSDDERGGDPPAPQDPYGVSKFEAEQALWETSVQTGLEVVVVRPPLVYGPGVKGNLLRLLRWVEHGLPLPLGAVNNKRSLVGLSNLVDLLLRCAEHPDAAGQTFLASDGHDLSTPQLIRLMAEGLDRPARLLTVPVALLQIGGRLMGRRDGMGRLLGSLQVDIVHTQSKLGWTPPESVEDGVRDMARWYAEFRVE